MLTVLRFANNSFVVLFAFKCLFRNWNSRAMSFPNRKLTRLFVLLIVNKSSLYKRPWHA
jgi:hypothetical protein